MRLFQGEVQPNRAVRLDVAVLPGNACPVQQQRMICASRLADTILLPGRSAGGTALCAGAPFRLKVFSSVRTDLNERLIICLPLFLPFLIMVQLPAAFSAKPLPAPGFAALLDRRPAFRAFVDWRVRVVPLRVVVPHPAFAAGAFLPRDVARWRKAHPTVQACQLIRHDAFPPSCVSSILPHWERFTTI